MVSDKTDAPEVTHVTIDDRRSGQRLDNFLIATLKGVPRTRIYRIVRRGEVRINRGRAKPDYRLQPGDVVRLPPVRTAAAARPPEAARFEWLLECVLYEDDAILVLDKPSGLAVHGGSGIQAGLIEGLRAVRPGAPCLELVHRLDKETSGCLLVAKSRPALTALHAALRAGGFTKEYLALVRGSWRGGARDVALELERDTGSGDRKVRPSATGRAASSRFVPEERFADATLVRVQLRTGRTHQARVHAAAIGHPIGGDDKYGDRAFNAVLRKSGLRRLFLHAGRLVFPHPDSGKAFAINAPLPKELASLLASQRP